jgi:hypothetical protein
VTSALRLAAMLIYTAPHSTDILYSAHKVNLFVLCCSQNSHYFPIHHWAFGFITEAARVYCLLRNLLLLLLLLLLFIAISFSPHGSSFYTNTDKTNKNKVYINETVHKHCTIPNTVNTSTHNSKIAKQLSEHPHITKHAHTRTHTLQTN